MKIFEKSTAIGLLLLILTNIAQAQQNSTDPDLPTNSFKDVYNKDYPNLKYQYHDDTQIHNYSGNWDFDGDGKNDSLFFVGENGAHLYFHLRIVLSTSEKAHTFEFLRMDNPFLYKSKKNKHTSELNMPSLFAVEDLDNDGLPEIFIKIEEQTRIPRKWRLRGITSNKIIVACETGRIKLRDYTSLGK